MAYLSLRDNRKNALVPKSPYEVSIGTHNIPLSKVHSCNVEADGLVRCRVLDINGYIFNKEHLFIPDVTSMLRSFHNIEASNIFTEDAVHASEFIGDGNKLKLDNLQDSLIPGSTTIDFGSPERKFRNLYLNNIEANHVFANKFIGD